MAAPTDIRQKQCAVIEFLVCEKETVGNIHKQLQKVYGDYAVNCSTVGRWAKWLSAEAALVNLRNRHCSGRPQSAQTEANVEKVNGIIFADTRVNC
jgi:hypothetical protein